LSTTVLWIHVICGITWITLCGTIAIVLLALGGNPAELGQFIVRGAPRLNRLCIGCAVVIPLSGLLNLMFAARASRLGLARDFVAIVSIKVAIFGLMAWAQWLAIDRFETVCRPPPENASGNQGKDGGSLELRDNSVTRGLVQLYAAIAALGGVALGMGVWLAGV
jgi:hypothetical protein